MTQRDLPVQADESAEDHALRALAGIAGWAVMHTTDGQHANGSLHKVLATTGIGRAVDLADRSGPGWDSEQLLAINEAVIRLIPLSMIAELIYAGPGGICVKNGQILDGRNGRLTALAVYGQTVLDGHHNHVHLAVIRGFTYNGSQEVAAPMPDDPNLPNIVGPVQFAIAGSDQSGTCTGYYIFSHATGELHSFGPGAPFYGRSEVVKLVAT